MVAYRIKNGMLQTDRAMQKQLQKKTDGIFRFKNKIEQSYKTFFFIFFTINTYSQ